MRLCRVAAVFMLLPGAWTASAAYTVEQIKSFIESPHPTEEFRPEGGGDAPPNEVDGAVEYGQAKLPGEVRDYAMNYTHTLPDSICLGASSRYTDTTGREAWQPTDVITARLSYFSTSTRTTSSYPRTTSLIHDDAYASVGGAVSIRRFRQCYAPKIFERSSHATLRMGGDELSCTVNKRQKNV